jgi:DUF1365 family protein
MVMKSGLLIATIMHARQRPKKHAFTYGAYYLCFALSDMRLLASRLLSLERWNLFSFYKKDYGARDGGALDDWIRKILAEHKITAADGDIVLVTLPRLLGYAFNPVSFWFCFDTQNRLRAVLSEVRNTFGEHHFYLSCHENHAPILSDQWLQAEKAFHVSPFLPVNGHYRFRFTCSKEQVRVLINYFDQDGLMLATSITGSRHDLTATQLLKCFIRYPLVTFKIIALIHSEALRLILKGARYHPKPMPPTAEVTK